MVRATRVNVDGNNRPLPQSDRSVNIRSLVVGLAMVFLLPTSPLSADSPRDDLVELPTLHVVGSSSEVRAAVRFRYHVMGLGVKSLAFDKLPPAWRENGVGLGDIVIGINGEKIEGKSLVEVIRLLGVDRKKGRSLDLEVLPKGSKQTRKIEVLFKENSCGLTVHYP